MKKEFDVWIKVIKEEDGGLTFVINTKGLSHLPREKQTEELFTAIVGAANELQKKLPKVN